MDMSLAAFEFISDQNLLLDLENEDFSVTRRFDSLEICQYWFTENNSDNNININGVNNYPASSTDVDVVVDSTIDISVEDIIASPPISPTATANNILLPETATSGKKRTSKTPAETSENRVAAERKRREKLSQRFISLAALIPTLKKMDKASILEDAMKYMKEIEESVKSLESSLKKLESDHQEVERLDQTKKQDMMMMMMEFEMDVHESKQNIVIRILCEDAGQDIASKVLSQLTTLQLTVLNSCFLPFGQRALEITIVAKKMEGSNVVICEQDLKQKLGEIIMT